MPNDQFAEWRKNVPLRVLLRESFTAPRLAPGGYIDMFERAHRSDMNPGQVANTVMAEFSTWSDFDKDDDDDEARSDLWNGVVREQIEEAVRRNREQP